jgi:membrane fusion protein, heavy metal efflux system
MRDRVRFATLLPLLLAAGAPACDSGRPPSEAPGPAVPSAGESKREPERTIRMTPEQMAAFGIAIGEAGPGGIETLIELPGAVRPDRDRVAHVRARFPGVVLEVRKHIGDRVEQGEALAIIESSQSLAPYPLKSLIAGTVISEKVARGDLASPDADVFTVADLSVVWVDLSIYQPDLERVRVGQPVLIARVSDQPAVAGEISYVAPIVDERTRTGVARVVLPNPDRVWRPGLFVTARVIVDVTEAPVVVPAEAVQNVADETVVFVPTPNGLSPLPVDVGRKDRRFVEVTSGLSPGDRFVSRGAFSLKTEIEKARSEEHHGD